MARNPINNLGKFAHPSKPRTIAAPAFGIRPGPGGARASGAVPTRTRSTKTK